MKTTRLTIHKIAQVDRVCAVPDVGLVHPSTRRGCISHLRHHGYLTAWRFLVENKAHQA